jgi:hypothetical protein
MSLLCSVARDRSQEPLQTHGALVGYWDELAVYSATPLDGDAWRAAKEAELACFAIPNGWATAESIAAGEVVDYIPYEDRSEIFTVTPANDPDRSVAAARMIWPDPELALPDQFLVSAAHRFDDQWSWFLDLVGLQHVSEWATLGSRATDGQPMFALISTLLHAAKARHINYWVQSITLPLMQGYQQALRVPILQIGEPELVVGALSIPTIIFLDEGCAGAMLAWDPDLKRRMFGPWAERRSVNGR